MNVISKAPATTTAPIPQDVDTYDARDLITKGVHACIVLDGKMYSLRITRAGKLILTK